MRPHVGECGPGYVDAHGLVFRPFSPTESPTGRLRGVPQAQHTPLRLPSDFLGEAGKRRRPL